MNTLEILTAARAKITDEKNWCQGAFARDYVGHDVGTHNEYACKWCSVGSLRSVDDSAYGAYSLAVDFLSRAMKSPIPDYNDSHSHAEVLAAWDKAISECAKGETE